MVTAGWPLRGSRGKKIPKYQKNNKKKNSCTDSRIIIVLVFLYFFVASAAPQRPTCSYHANPAGSPTKNDMSLQVGEKPDLNLGLQVSQPGALPLSHHIPSLRGCGTVYIF